jgi:hypothetical protein
MPIRVISQSLLKAQSRFPQESGLSILLTRTRCQGFHGAMGIPEFRTIEIGMVAPAFKSRLSVAGSLIAASVL